MILVIDHVTIPQSAGSLGVSEVIGVPPVIIRFERWDSPLQTTHDYGNPQQKTAFGPHEFSVNVT